MRTYLFWGYNQPPIERWTGKPLRTRPSENHTRSQLQVKDMRRLQKTLVGDIEGREQIWGVLLSR